MKEKMLETREMKTADDEARIEYLVELKYEINRLLSNDSKFHDLYTVLMLMSSVQQLTILKSYITYKIQYLENNKHKKTSDVIQKILDLIYTERVAEITPHKRKHAELEHTVTDTNVVKSANKWFP